MYLEIFAKYNCFDGRIVGDFSCLFLGADSSRCTSRLSTSNILELILDTYNKSFVNAGFRYGWPTTKKFCDSYHAIGTY